MARHWYCPTHLATVADGCRRFWMFSGEKGEDGLLSVHPCPGWRVCMAGLALSLAFLGGCTVGPDFKPPEASSVAHYVLQEAQSRAPQISGQQLHAGQVPDKHWWRVFTVPAFNRIMEQALQHNPSLAAAQAALGREQEQLRAVRGSALLPQVDVSGAAQRRKFGVADVGPDVTVPAFTSYSLGPKISYLLDFAGGQRRAVEQQAALTQVQQYRFAATRLALSGQVLDQTLALAAAHAQLQVVQAIIADDQKNVQLVDIAVHAGAATRTDQLSVRTQLATDQALLPPLRQQVSTAEHALAVLVGQPPAVWQPPAFMLDTFTLPHDLPLRLPSELVHARPDILAAESQVHAASAAIGVATARLYPSITLGAGFTQESLTTSALFNGESTAFGLGANLEAPLFNGGSLRAQKRAAEETYQAALAQYRQVVLQAFGQVADVLKALEHDAQEMAAQQQTLATATESLRLARISYKAGNSGVLQVLDAERALNRARLQVIRVQMRRLQDTALFYLALGGGPLSGDKANEGRS